MLYLKITVLKKKKKNSNAGGSNFLADSLSQGMSKLDFVISQRSPELNIKTYDIQPVGQIWSILVRTLKKKKNENYVEREQKEGTKLNLKVY